MTPWKKGKLQCKHCGQTFTLRDGQEITINHFKNCEGLQ